MNPDLTYSEAVKKSKSLRALGITELYLSKGDMPWHIAISCEPGGTHRLDMATSVWFRGKDDKSGLSFRWCFEIEPMSANGKGSYEIDVRSCLDVLAKLPSSARYAFRKYLSECAVKVQSKADEWKALADRQQKDAAALRQLAKR